MNRTDKRSGISVQEQKDRRYVEKREEIVHLSIFSVASIVFIIIVFALI